jgi:hypothetical protein
MAKHSPRNISDAVQRLRTAFDAGSQELSSLNEAPALKANAA